ncbi:MULTISPECIES: diguanylate cyclase [unclassified Rhizobium]|uniref:GGDEF domain-containing response regulator n=1 Tax=unclassified Rhizobium TaxID=2613769 RepID=UPI001602987A|nr:MULTISPECIES: diguanylate cyclase [unclassified Rhizobium]MBB1250799.1 diguanylate cyclase [Rhizobium sp. G21]MCV3764448.1 diguanylate cyclase [Rhizobium sp. TRM95796]
MLVEDTRFYSTAIRDRLERRLNSDVHHSPTLAGVMRLIEAEGDAFDLAILDLCQADAANGEALDFVMSRGIPSIVFSGISSDRKRDELLAREVVDYVPKCSSGSIDLLVRAVERFLSYASASILVYDQRGSRSPLIENLEGGAHPFTVASRESEVMRILDHSDGVQLALIDADVGMGACAAFIDRVQQRYPQDRLRIIGFSTRQRDGDVAEFFRAGGDDFVHLPVVTSELLGRIDHMLAMQAHIHALRRMASRDYLTDLYNRRYFYELGPKMVETGLRQGQALAMGLLDIDHFKRLNDTYGHEIGDVVLKSVAKRLVQHVANSTHIAARLGGEEFGVLFVGLDIEQALASCEKLRQDIGDIRIVVGDEEISVTVSMGLAAISDEESFDNYLNAADQYLYLAKNSGRNRVFSDYQVARMAAA